MPKNQQSNKPVRVIRIGSLSASVWRREGKENDFFTVTANRAYKDGDTWKYSDSFGRDDLLTVAKLLDLAHTAICKLEAEEKTQ
jgi:hypothetical protein